MARASPGPRGTRKECACLLRLCTHELLIPPLPLLEEPGKESAVCPVFMYPALGLVSDIYPAPGSTLK